MVGAKEQLAAPEVRGELFLGADHHRVAEGDDPRRPGRPPTAPASRDRPQSSRFVRDHLREFRGRRRGDIRLEVLVAAPHDPAPADQQDDGRDRHEQEPGGRTAASRRAAPAASPCRGRAARRSGRRGRRGRGPPPAAAGSGSPWGGRRRSPGRVSASTGQCQR